MRVFRRERSRLSYANVISTIALFVALGGASYAASGALAPHSVGTRQLRDGAVAPPKLGFGYQSGVTRSARGGQISLAVDRCSKLCPPAHVTVVATSKIMLTRPARVMVNVSNSVFNASRGSRATVDLNPSIGSTEPCSTTSVVGPGDVDTVSCIGPTSLRPGDHRLYVFENASASGPAPIKASDVVVTWWTLPPAGHYR